MNKTRTIFTSDVMFTVSDFNNAFIFCIQFVALLSQYFMCTCWLFMV